MRRVTRVACIALSIPFPLKWKMLFEMHRHSVGGSALATERTCLRVCVFVCVCGAVRAMHLGIAVRALHRVGGSLFLEHIVFHPFLFCPRAIWDALCCVLLPLRMDDDRHKFSHLITHPAARPPTTLFAHHPAAA